jgi:hypothetical protein
MTQGLRTMADRRILAAYGGLARALSASHVILRFLAILTLFPSLPAADGARDPAQVISHPAAKADIRTENWRAVEMTFASAILRPHPLDTDLNAIFVSPSGKNRCVPGFWDGGTVWRVRFAPDESGIWTYTSTCSDAADGGLNGQSGRLQVAPYNGPLDIYRKGFVRTMPGVRHFMYADGSPFFYLGDTHWSMPQEPFEEMFAPIVRRRVAQGFTVYQSECLGARYDLSNGFDEADLPGFRDLDRRFQCIADAGLVHAHAQLFFTPEIIKPCYTEDYLRKLCRMWVARYGAYPVMWTTAQEVDNDFYADRGDRPLFDATSNPWKRILGWMHEYDPYGHPGTAHMEFMGQRPEPKVLPPMDQRPRWGYGVVATTSSFREVPGHTWYAIQWTPPNNAGMPWQPLKDFWENGQGKPLVNYEGSYDHLWTLNDGARLQGWASYLNGMFGHGYGAADIWYYRSNYDMDNDSVRGRFTITVEQKKTPWTSSIDFPSATELGIHMKGFLTSIAWWKLTPRFDDRQWFAPDDNAWYCLATIDSDLYVLYLYNWSSTASGTLRGMRDGSYGVKWFNTRSGAYSEVGTIRPMKDPLDGSSVWRVPPKPDASDWILLAILKTN